MLFVNSFDDEFGLSLRFLMQNGLIQGPKPLDLWYNIPNKEAPVSIGRTIRTLREQQGLTQRELAERADLQQSYVSRMENQNRDRVDVIPLTRIALALDVTVDEILIHARLQPKPVPRDELQWRALQRLFRKLPEHHQQEVLAIAQTLLELSETLKPHVIGRPAPRTAEQDQSYSHEEDLDDAGPTQDPTTPDEAAHDL